MSLVEEQGLHVRIQHKNDGTWFKPSPKEFNIMTWNINRLMNKIDDLENYILSFDGILHVVVVVETFLNRDTINGCVLSNYTPYHNVRTDTGGGGVTIFVHDAVTQKASPEVILSIVTPDLNHFLTLKFREMYITGVYRRPGGQKTTFINELDEYCLSRSNNVLCGDFNFDLLSLNDNDVSEYVETIVSNGFLILNDVDATSVTRLASMRILDHVITDKLDKSFKMALRHSSRSDHCLIILSMDNSESYGARRITKTKVDIQSAAHELNEASFSLDNGNQLNQCLVTAVNNHTQEINIRSNNRIRKPYITCETLKLIRQRDFLCVLKHLHPENELLIDLYKYVCKQIKTMIHQSKTEYYDGKFDAAASDERKQWQLYKEVVFRKVSSGPENLRVCVDGMELDDSTESANVINERFANAGYLLEQKIIDQHGFDMSDIDHLYPNLADNNWNFQPVSTHDVLRIIKELPSNKSPGIDKVPTELLKLASDKLVGPLTSCINESILTNIFPEDLTIGKLKLIHKNGDNDIDNFRGITVTQAVSKAYEKVYVNQLNEYLSQVEFFDGPQYGFQAASGTQGAAFQVINYLKSNNKKFSACLFIDLKRAFETVNHQRLVAKLRRIGLSVEATNLMQSFLQRRIRTNINGFTSDPMLVKTGIGQGTILGPLHFILYINDLLDLHLNGDLTFYADDGAVTYAFDTAEELQQAMQDDLDVLNKWFIINLLTLNVKKTEYMLFGKARYITDLVLEIAGQSITRTYSFKYLGLQLDPKLDFGLHVSSIRQKVGAFTNLMWRCQQYIPSAKKKQLYFAYVVTHLSNMMAIWGAELSSNKMQMLRVVQNKSLKAIYGLKRETNTTYLYTKSIIPVELMLSYEQIVNIHKMRRNLTKNFNHIMTNAEAGIRTTRQSHQVYISPNNTLLELNIKHYNKLDISTMQQPTLARFKDEVKVSLIGGSSEFRLISPFIYLN